LTYAFTGVPSEALTSNGVAVVWTLDTATNTVTGTAGALTIITVVLDSATGEYTVTLDGAVDHADNTQEDIIDFTIPTQVTDNHGATAASTLKVIIEDDSPVAVNDTAAIAEDDVSTTGNVLANDAAGADDNETVSAVAGNPADVGQPVSLNHGEITLDSNGDYTYTLDNTDPAVQALAQGETLTETISYTMIDADGDESQATLTITITGTNDAPT
ncbi:VCBS domain-containing protein, partial [Streptococcus pneumoniae]